jgi:hypothetical protein
VLGALGRQTQVVGDEQHRGAELGRQLLEVVQDPPLHGHVERRGRLVRDQQLRPGGEADRDQRTLPHAAGELVRVLLGAASRIRQPGLGQQLGHPLVGLLAGAGEPVGLQRLTDLVADAPHRVEVGHRVLRDQADLPTADRHDRLRRGTDQLTAVEGDRPTGHLAGPGQQVDERVRRRRLARARLADDGDRLAGEDRQVRLADRLDDAGRRGERHVEVTDLEQRRARVPSGSPGSRPVLVELTGTRHLDHVRAHRLRAFGSRASRTASPIMMKPSTVRASAPAG